MADFFERAEPIFDLYGQGRYGEALHLADQLAREFPEKSVNTSYWRLCLLALLGRKEAALQVMDEAISNGLWWSEARLRAESDLLELQRVPEFERLVAECKQRQVLAKAHARPERIILEPDSITGPLPLLIVLHGRDGSAEREKHHWKMAPELGWLTVLAQSSQMSSLDSYVWDDVELSQRELQAHFKELQMNYALDAGRIVLGGFSQGGAMAILLALRGDIPCVGFLAISPGWAIHEHVIPTPAEPAKARGVHGVIVAGGKDPRFSTIVQLGATLSKHGTACQLETRPELGHAYPSDFNELLERTLSTFHKEQE